MKIPKTIGIGFIRKFFLFFNFVPTEFLLQVFAPHGSREMFIMKILILEEVCGNFFYVPVDRV